MMKIQQHLNHFGYWAQARLFEAISGQEQALSPSDVTFLFSILLCLSPDSAFENFPVENGGVTIDTEEKNITLAFTSSDNRLIEEFLYAVGQLNFSPGGWKLTILRTGDSFAIRTVELPDQLSF